MRKTFLKRVRTCPFWLAAAWLSVAALMASEHKGVVKYGELPIPGATVTVSQGDKKFVTVTDQQGAYSFADLADGSWNIEVEMLCFTTIKQDVNVAAGAAPSEWTLKLMPIDELKAVAGPAAPPPPPKTADAPAGPAVGGETASAPVANTAIPEVKGSRNNNKKGAAAASSSNGQNSFQRTDVNASNKGQNGNGQNPSGEGQQQSGEASSDLNKQASDGFLINGSSNNGAASPFAMSQAFGNFRRGPRSLYNGNIGLTIDNSALDAQNFSLTGQDTPKPAYNHMTGLFSFGGPMKIPHLFNNGPNFIVNYQWLRNTNASTQPTLMPTQAERNGDFSQTLSPLGTPVQIFDPTNGMPFAGGVIPASRISDQARALLNFYPLPNFAGSSRYNYQIPIVSPQHQDSLQTRLNKGIGRKNQITGTFGLQDTRQDTPNIFGFLDTTDTLGYNIGLNWRHTFTTRLYGTASFSYSRFSQRLTPFFANRENVSGEAGITGNNQEAVNWGPPSLQFASGTAGLSDGNSSFIRNQTNSLGYNLLWNKGRHTFQFGADYKRIEFNYLSQSNPRGSFTFNGTSTQGYLNGTAIPGTGSDLAGFLLGIPDTSAIAYGNADKYFRTSTYDAYVQDDWRVGPGFTVNFGLRWDYSAPIIEKYGRLVNLDVMPGFSAIAPVVASSPTGLLTGNNYPDSLINPDKHNFQPRVAISWRPFAASSMVVRASYGVYVNTSVYQSIAIQMAQQSPLSKSLSVANTAANPLTLASGFNIPPGVTPNTFAVDPNFLVGYAQNWTASVQRDLPGSLQMTASYLGIKGTRGMQAFLPNTYPTGAENPCPLCPSGYTYLSSNGNSTRESGTMQLRRRLHNGITAQLQYTYSKSIDDSALGGRGQSANVIAQNWLDLSAERALSTFDQRHLLTLQGQYTSGMGMGGGTLLSGWRGALLKEWTVLSQVTLGSGLPLTPLYSSNVTGTGVTGPIRPYYTGASLYDAPDGFYLNRAAYTAPLPGQWGNAGRDTIIGPRQFTISASLGRTFRINDRYSLDLRVDATNPLNHVTWASWVTNINSSQFGLPTNANGMRSLQTTFRLRF